MAKAAKKEPTKKRGKYEEKLKVDMSFEDLIKKAGEQAKAKNAPSKNTQ